MAASTVFSLNYRFDIDDFNNLKPGDSMPSSCPPTDTIDNGRSVIYSPRGFPLQFTLHLICAKRLHATHNRLWLRLCLHQPGDVSCLPALLVQPTPVPKLKFPYDIRPVSLDPRLVGPQQSANWALAWHSGPFFSIPFLWPGPLKGEFRFKLLDEPRYLIARLPPLSKAVWSCLPQDMVSAVLRELPLADLVSARLVCHEWKRILDTDSRAWSKVIHLQSIGMGVDREGPYDYHDARLNQVRYHSLYKALDFLTSRKAPIQTLELYQNLKHMKGLVQDKLQNLPSVLSKHNIKLKGLLFHDRYWYDPTDPYDGLLAERSVAVKLMKSQPSLERVHLEMMSVPLQTILASMPRLRILSLGMEDPEFWPAFLAQVPQLSSLIAFRIVTTYLGMKPGQLANISKAVEGQGYLRRVPSLDWPAGNQEPCKCSRIGSAVVWASGELSPTAAAALLMPPHFNAFGRAFHHHI